MKLSLIFIFLSQCCGIDNTYARVERNNKILLDEARKVSDMNECRDSPAKFKVTVDGKKTRKYCSWVAKGTPARIQDKCNMAEVHKHCKNTCGNIQCCEDSSSTFKVGKKSKTCEWVKLKREKRCKYEGILETCTRTCTDCTPPPSLEQRFSALVLKVDSKVGGLETQIDNLEIKVEEVESLQTQVDSLVSEVETLEDNLDELKNDNSNLVSRITLLETTATHCCPSTFPSLRPSAIIIVPSASPSNDPSSAPFDTPSAIATWLQLGGDIDGEDECDRSGHSVSLSKDGLTVAIGALGNDGNGTNSGHVRVYSYNNTNSKWLQVGQDIDGEDDCDHSGWYVSLSEDGLSVAIGAARNDGNGANSGHVRVYSYNNVSSKWLQVGQDIDGEDECDWSGNSVSLSEDGVTVAIGARNDDDNGTNSGHVRVYSYNNTNSKWLQVGQDIDGEDVHDQSGHSVSLSEDGLTVAIGARNDDGNGTNSGHVRVYSYNNTNSKWLQVGQDIEGEDEADLSGWSVSLSEDGLTVAIGAIHNDGHGITSGHVRVYSYNNDNSKWYQVGQDIDGEYVHDESGYSVSLSEDGLTVAIGAIYNSDNGSKSGHARVYSYNNANSKWLQVGQDIDGEDECDKSGYSVSLSEDGVTVAIGAAYNDSNGTNSGHVRVYRLV